MLVCNVHSLKIEIAAQSVVSIEGYDILCFRDLGPFHIRLVDRGLEAYRSLYEAFLGGASFANILMSSGVGSVSLSNLALTSPLGAATYTELPS